MHAHTPAAAPFWPAQLHFLGTATQRSEAGAGVAPAALLNSHDRSRSTSSSRSSNSRSQQARPGSPAPFGPLLRALPVLLLLLAAAAPSPVVGRRLIAAPRRHLAADRASDSNTAAQQPCVPCSSCLTRGCYNMCSNSCAARSYGGGGFASSASAYGFAGAGGGFPDPGQCKQDGLDIADDVAQQACRGVQSMCQAGVTRQALQDARGVPSSQCAAQANASCQKAALASSQTPCGANLYFGFRSCSGRQFNDLYRSYVSDGCQAATSRY